MLALPQNGRTFQGQLEQLIVPNQDTAATSLTYVTGTHNIKVGMQWGFGSNGYPAVQRRHSTRAATGRGD